MQAYCTYIDDWGESECCNFRERFTASSARFICLPSSAYRRFSCGETKERGKTAGATEAARPIPFPAPGRRPPFVERERDENVLTLKQRLTYSTTPACWPTDRRRYTLRSSSKSSHDSSGSSHKQVFFRYSILTLPGRRHRRTNNSPVPSRYLIARPCIRVRIHRPLVCNLHFAGFHKIHTINKNFLVWGSISWL